MKRFEDTFKPYGSVAFFLGMLIFFAVVWFFFYALMFLQN